MEIQLNQSNQTEWIDVDYIQKNILPLSKKKIRALIKDNLDVVEAGNKLLCEKSQLLSYLRGEF